MAYNTTPQVNNQVLTLAVATMPCCGAELFKATFFQVENSIFVLG
jgi:hypothetical protein